MRNRNVGSGTTIEDERLAERAGLEGDAWRLDLWAKNVFDEEYAVIAFPLGAPPPLPAAVGQAGDPITLGASLTVEF